MKILFLDDDSTRHDAAERLYPDAEIYHAYDRARFQYWILRASIAQWRFDLVSFDHDLGQSYDGRDLARWLCSTMPRESWPREFVVHSFNTVGAERIMSELVSWGVAPRRGSLTISENSSSERQ